MNAAALVIGVNAYPRVDADLKGCVDDAVDAVNWLIEIGVPAERIRAHISPKDQHTLPDKVAVGEATRNDVSESVADLLGESGDQLFIFLSGHGLYAEQAGTIFLLSDFDRNNRTDRNIPVHELADLCLYSGFKDTLIVFDACQNADKTNDAYRSKIAPGSLPNLGGHPKDGHAVFLAMAAAKLTKAPVIKDRSLLTTLLLQAMKDAANQVPMESAEICDYDWNTGTAKLNFTELFDFVKQQVKAQAGDHDRSQRPARELFGRLTEDDAFLLTPLKIPPPLKLNVVVDKPDALEEVTVKHKGPHFVQRRFPRSALNGKSLQVCSPTGARLDVTCDPKFGWTADPDLVRRPSFQKGETIRFVLKKPPVPCSGGGQLVAFEFQKGKKKRPNAKDVSIVSDVMREANLPITVRKLPQLDSNDISINVRGEPGLDGKFDLQKIEQALKSHSDGGDDLWTVSEVSLPATERPPDTPNLIFDTGETNPFGFLGSRNVVHLRPLDRSGRGDEQRFSPDVLARMGEFRVDPGLYRVSVDLPWGKWTDVVQVPFEDSARVNLKAPTDIVPLRNRPQDTTRISANPVWLTGLRSLGTHLDENRIDDLAAAAQLQDIIVMITRESEDAKRVEPYSTIEHEAFDQIFSEGDLLAVDLDDAFDFMIGLDFEEGQTNLFALGLAHAHWAQRGKEAARRIADCLDILTPGFQYVPDAELLARAISDSAGPAVQTRPLLSWSLDFLTPEEWADTPRPTFRDETVFAQYQAEDAPEQFGAFIGAEYAAVSLVGDQIADEDRRQAILSLHRSNAFHEAVEDLNAEIEFDPALATKVISSIPQLALLLAVDTLKLTKTGKRLYEILLDWVRGSFTRD